MLSGKPSTRREVISGTLRHEGARRSRALRAVPPDVHLVPRRGNAGRAPVSRFEVDVTGRYRTQVAGHQPTIASTRRARQWSGETSAKPRPLRARRPKLKPSQPYVGGGIDCQILTSAPAAWSEPARPSARRCSAQAAHRLVSVSSLASGSTERAHRRHFQVITATTLRRIQRPRPDRSEVTRRRRRSSPTRCIAPPARRAAWCRTRRGAAGARGGPAAAGCGGGIADRLELPEPDDRVTPDRACGKVEGYFKLPRGGTLSAHAQRTAPDSRTERRGIGPGRSGEEARAGTRSGAGRPATVIGLDPITPPKGIGLFAGGAQSYGKGLHVERGPARGHPVQTFVQCELALGEPVMRTGRDRQAAVGIPDGGGRQQRLSDIAVAARPRQPRRRQRGTYRAGGTTPPSPTGGDPRPAPWPPLRPREHAAARAARKFALSKAQVRLAQAAMAHRDTSVSELCRELGIRPVTLIQVRRTAGTVAREGREGPPPPEPECSNLDAGVQQPRRRRSTCLTLT